MTVKTIFSSKAFNDLMKVLSTTINDGSRENTSAQSVKQQGK